jgi:membrane protein YdbS with pleckstrin-like domain
MTGDWLALDPGETVRWEAHPRYMRAAPAVAASLVIAVAAVGAAVTLDPRGLVGLLLAPLPSLYGYLRVVTTVFVVTDRALYRRRGVVGVEVRTVEHDRVQNTRSSRGVLGNVFGYGTVEVEVAGGRDLRFYDVYDPDDVRRLIERLGGTRLEVPGSVEQWRAVRGELRAIRRLLEAHSK